MYLRNVASIFKVLKKAFGFALLISCDCHTKKIPLTKRGGDRINKKKTRIFLSLEHYFNNLDKYFKINVCNLWSTV